MKTSPTPQRLSFQSKLERIAEDMEYFALPVPEKISHALGTKGPVLVSATVNDSTPFQVSLFPVGGGRHYIRIKAKVWKEVKITEGDRVKVKIAVIDREKVAIPKDLQAALRAAGAEEAFKTITPGKRSYAIRLIDDAAKPETRAKRIQDAVKIACEKRGGR
jgi:hypothetical protein